MKHTLLVVVVLAIVGLLVVSPLAWAHDSGFGLVRYTSDGVLDRSFGTGGVVVARSAQRSLVANALALQPDGRILIAGMATDLPSATLRLAVERYNADGSVDERFGAGGIVTASTGSAGAEARALALQPDGKIVVAGTAFAHGTTDDQFVVTRISPDGDVDATFGSGGFVSTHVGAAAAGVQAMALQADGRILVAGTAYSNGQTDDDFALARYTPEGRLDTGFGSGGMVTTDFGTGEPGANPSLDRAGGIGVESDGTIIVAGSTRGDHQAFAVARYTPEGRLDSSFGVGGKTQVVASEPQVYAVVIQTGGTIVVAGSTATGVRGTAPFALLRLSSAGFPDPAFGVGGLVTASVEGSRSGARAVVAQADGKLLTGGAKYGAPTAQGDAVPNSGFALARYETDGRLDAGFGEGGKTLTDLGDAGATPLTLAVQPDGKIVAAGLVFFQVPPQVGPFDTARRLAIPAATVTLVVLTALVLRLLRLRLA